MKITSVETVRVREFPNLLFVQVGTDAALTGLGETFYGSAAVEAHIHAIAAPALLGQDPLRIEWHNRNLAGYVGYAGSGTETRARSAIDIALWDIRGKASGQPLYTLLGGATKPYVAVYNTCAGPNYVRRAEGQAVANWGLAEGQYEDLTATLREPERLAEELVAANIAGMKIWPFDPFAEASGGTYISARDIDRALEPLKRVRSAVGKQIEIMVELHALWDVPTARQIMKALEDVEPYWVEDPVRLDIVDGLASVADKSPLRIAAGETAGGLRAVKHLLDSRAVDVVTVDLTWTGGITEARKVAALADVYGIPVAPHDCTGPVALTACAHLSTAAPNSLFQETVRAGYLGWYNVLVEGLPRVENGRIAVTDSPGLGVELRADLLGRSGTTVVRSEL